MSNSLSPLSRRASLPQCLRTQHDLQQVRHATLIRRPKRPYTFTQLVTLSDGSTYMHRTTSPIPVYKATKDVRNSPLWNPSSRKLLKVEDDEAGKLAGFRSRFGRAWDSEGAADVDEAASSENRSASKQKQDSEDSLLDMIGSYQNKTSDGAGGKSAEAASMSKNAKIFKKK